MWTVPNIITLIRICFTPVIALLPFIEGYWPKLIEIGRASCRERV